MGNITSSHLGTFQMRYRLNTMVEFTGRYEGGWGDTKRDFWELGLHLDW